MKLTVLGNPRKDVVKFLSEAKGLPDFESSVQGNMVEIEADDDDDIEYLAEMFESFGFECETEGEDGAKDGPFHMPRMRLGAGTEASSRKNLTCLRK